MADRDTDLFASDKDLLAACEVDTYRASGPGGQHRNKVSSAIRLRHRDTGVVAQAEERRSQHENRRRALSRLRQKLACEVRCPVAPGGELPATLDECLIHPRRGPNAGKARLEVGRKDARFWPVAAAVLDVLEGHEGRLSDAAAAVGISTSNLAGFLKSDRHLLDAAQRIRRAHGQQAIR